MITIIIGATTKGILQDGTDLVNVKIQDFSEAIVLIVILSLFQIIAYRLVYRATVNKEVIMFNNGQFVKWDNIKFITRLHHLYLMRTKDKKRYYLFPTERQTSRLLGDKIEYTDMDQIINIKSGC